MGTYLRKNRGIIKLYVNNVLLDKQTYLSKNHRKEVIDKWNEAFAPFKLFEKGVVYIQITIDEMEDSRYKQEEIKKQTFTRPKAEYSNGTKI